MTGKERFIKALKHEPITGLVPHFELVFYLTMEVLGKVHPSHRNLAQWYQMSSKEKELQLQDAASSYIDIAERYDHSAIFVHTPPPAYDDMKKRILEIIRERTGDEYFLMMSLDPTFSMPDGEEMMDFTVRMYEDESGLKDEAAQNTEEAIEFAYKAAGWGGLVDGFALCADYSCNANPFFTPQQFSDYITPYLKETITTIRELGFYSIKHTDGNILPILDQILECSPDALHSIDPQGGMDLKYFKEYCGDKICLIGNVNCGLLQTGTDEEAKADILRSLHDGMPGYGYIFSTSNCIYTGLDLSRYELMHGLWHKHGAYK